jgi:hypothetical protein
VGHLVDFEEAEAKADKYPTKENFIEVALCAVAVSKRKNQKVLPGPGQRQRQTGLSGLVSKEPMI